MKQLMEKEEEEAARHTYAREIHLLERVVLVQAHSEQTDVGVLGASGNFRSGVIDLIDNHLHVANEESEEQKKDEDKKRAMLVDR